MDVTIDVFSKALYNYGVTSTIEVDIVLEMSCSMEKRVYI